MEGEHRTRVEGEHRTRWRESIGQGGGEHRTSGGRA